MNKQRIAFSAVFIATVLLVSISLTGCDVLGEKVTADQRMTMFKNVVNAGQAGDNFDNLKQHTSSGATLYNEPSATLWETYFAGNNSFTYTMTGEGTATATENSINYTFYLRQDTANVYVIYRIDRTSGTPATIFY